MYSTGTVITQQISLEHNAIAVCVLVAEDKKKWDYPVIEVGILIAISRIVSQNNKDKMVVLSNQKQGKPNYHNEWQDLSDRKREEAWLSVGYGMRNTVNSPMWVNFKIILSFFTFFKIYCLKIYLWGFWHICITLTVIIKRKGRYNRSTLSVTCYIIFKVA